MHFVRIATGILTLALVTAPGLALAEQHEKATPPADAPATAGTPGTTKEWNQEEVAKVAADFAAAVQRVRRTARDVPTPGVQTGQEARWMRFDDTLRVLQNQSRTFSRQLADGKGHDETLRRYQRMWTLIRDLRTELRSMEVTQDLQAQIDVAAGFLDQLDAYYA